VILEAVLGKSKLKFRIASKLFFFFFFLFFGYKHSQYSVSFSLKRILKNCITSQNLLFISSILLSNLFFSSFLPFFFLYSRASDVFKSLYDAIVEVRYKPSHQQVKRLQTLLNRHRLDFCQLLDEKPKSPERRKHLNEGKKNPIRLNKNQCIY